MTIGIKEAIQKIVVEKSDLNREESEAVFELIMRDDATPAQIAAFLTGLRMKGETVEEVVGAGMTMRRAVVRVNPHRRPLVDTCGTGGSRFRVFNVSTAAAFVAACAGVAVAKHGNRAMSGVCGSADVLEALGVALNLAPEANAACIDHVGIGFLFAQAHHPAMKQVAVPRREIGFRTIFNILGPLTNPAGATRQVLGVYHPDLCGLVVGALKELGSERAIVLHGEVGLDEISTLGKTYLLELRAGEIQESWLTPQDFGLIGEEPNPTWLAPADTPEQNAEILREVLAGIQETPEQRARLNLVAVNAAAALRVSGMVEDWKDATQSALEILKYGKALEVVDRLVGYSNQALRTGASMLTKILMDKRIEVADRRDKESLEGLQARCKNLPPPRDFFGALQSGEGVALIAEVKKASPSKGVIREDFDPVAIAKIYAENGATCLSVLTDAPYFQGRLEFIQQIKAEVSIPILRKDFILDEWQVYESRVAGADAILLIVAGLTVESLQNLMKIATDLEMAVLVEVHNDDELSIALDSGAKLIGINNRDLKTFHTDIETTTRLLQTMPPDADRLVVSESGIFTHEQVAGLYESGAKAILVGESLMREADIGAKVRELLGRTV